jgi:hypothetical protein
MRTHVLFFAACLAGGCVVGMRDPFESTFRVGLVTARPVEPPDLAAAGETATHFEEMVTEGAEEPVPVEGEPPRPAKVPAGTGMCVRAGVLAVAGAQRGGTGIGPLVGFSYGQTLRPALQWEAGLDVVPSQSRDVGFTSTLVAGRFDVLLQFKAGSGPYAAGGLGALFEAAREDGTGYLNYAGTLNLGVGSTFREKRADARATVSFLLGSDNSPAFVQLSAGYRF